MEHNLQTQRLKPDNAKDGKSSVASSASKAEITIYQRLNQSFKNLTNFYTGWPKAIQNTPQYLILLLRFLESLILHNGIESIKHSTETK